MKKQKIIVALYTGLTVLFVGGAFVAAAFFSYEKYMESERERTAQYFNDISCAAVEQIQAACKHMIEETQNTAYILSLGAADDESVSRCFTYQYSATDAQAGICFQNDGSLIYGDREYGEKFAPLGRRAMETQAPAVSDTALCEDGEMRFAVAVPSAWADGSVGAVLLVYPVSALSGAVDGAILNGEGRVALVHGDGSPVAARDDAAGSWDFRPAGGGSFANTVGELVEYEAEAKKDSIYVYAKPVGINDWLVTCGAAYGYLDKRAEISMAINHGPDAIALALVALTLFIAMATIRSRRRKLLLAKRRFSIAVNQSARAVYQYDRRNDKFSIISKCENINLPRGERSLSLAVFFELIHPADRNEFRNSIGSISSVGTVSVTVRISGLSGTEDFRWYHIDATQLSPCGQGSTFVIGSIEDIDERERERLILREKATTDPLTGLYDRVETQRIVNECLGKLETNESSTFCIIDLDNFKSINDRHGHDCGDRALLFFSERLKSTFRFGDVIGRLGGDEFIVYMSLTADRQVAERRFAELMGSISQGSEELDLPEISCSIGYITAKRGDSFQSVYKRADKAMYKAKIAGKRQAVGE